MIDDFDSRLTQKLLQARQRRGWSLADLAERSGVSKSMLSRIERGEASPTAALLARVASAFGDTLAAFLTFPDQGERLARAADQPIWRDPQTGYLRRQVFLDARSGLAITEVDLPPGAEVAFPAAVFLATTHVVFVLAGRLTLGEGEIVHELVAGDRLAFGEASDIVYRNASVKPCRYLVTVTRNPG